MLSGSEGSFGDELEKEIGLLLREQRRQDDEDDFEKDLSMYRSGSAPPTVEGSLTAVGGLFNHVGGSGGAFLGFSNNNKDNGCISEEELRSDPAYLSYYYSNVNLNPRLPPPLLSKEDWRSSQRLQGGSSGLGGIGDRRKLIRNDSVDRGRSLFTMPPGFGSKKGEKDSEAELEKVNSSAEWGGDGLIGLPGLGLSGKKKSIAEIFQDDIGHAAPPGIPSRPSSRTAFDNGETLGPAEAELAHLRSELVSKENSRTSVAIQSPSFQSIATPASYSYTAVVGASSLSRSTTPDPKVIARTPSPCLPPIGGERVNALERRSNNSPNSFKSVSATVTGSTDLITALSNMNLSNGVVDEQSHLQTDLDYFFKKDGSGGCDMAYRDSKRSSGSGSDFSNSALMLDRQSSLHRTNLASPNKPYPKASPASTHNNRLSLPSHYQHFDNGDPSVLSYGLEGYSAMPSMMTGHLGSPNMASLYENTESQNMNRTGGRIGGNTLQAPLMDPMYLQYLSAEYAALNDPSMGNAYMDLLQKAYVGSLLSPQKSPIGVPMGGKTGVSNHNNYYGNHTFGVGLSYPGSPLGSPVIPNSPGGPVGPLRYGHGNMRYPSSTRNLGSGEMGSWNLQGGYRIEDSFGSSLLEEFKSNKARCFELAEIAGHVVEFSADQYGSRFIQQKLETATIEEKNIVFEEINPQALNLMTDVFGNYVIQKFFEHGIASQRRVLADKLMGNVLTLSLQMYGCRVIQKAIEVVDLDQKIKMVVELDGHVMRCVRDQNGNHVIQKCIECVPEEHIQFIVTTFFDQVVILSTHPYGCRVIQRILEHCADPQTQSKVMEEVLGSVSMLAQDQYGNYVVQHVLEHGKPDERSTIIKELAGKIVQMSQQKFASNVVEKCLTFGGPAERLLLVNEMLGTTDENEPLQAMMKDQFANYVVQKVLETCDDQHREFILSRIKVHLNALKKYTYGKHIVARVEKLVAAGERRTAIAAQSSHPN